MTIPTPDQLEEICAAMVHGMGKDEYLPLPIIWDGRQIGTIAWLKHGTGFAHITDEFMCSYMKSIIVASEDRKVDNYDGHYFAY